MFSITRVDEFCVQPNNAGFDMTHDTASATARVFTLQWTLSVVYPVFTDNDILLLISHLVFEIISAIFNDVVT